MQKRVSYFAIFSILIFFSTIHFTGCSTKPDNILSKKSFTKILAEFIYIENLAVTNSQKQALIKRTLETYNTTVEEFNITKAYYKQDAKFWLKVYKQAQEKIKNRETDLQKIVNQNSPADKKPSVLKK